MSEKVKREPVDFDYTALNWDFLKLLAMIPPYAAEKYGSWEQYAAARLEGEKSPANHMIEHLRQYMAGEPYDKFDGDVGRHLVAVAYNAMMEWFYLKKFGHKAHPLTLGAGAGPKFGGNPFPPTKIADLMAKEADEGLMPVGFGDHRDHVWPEEITDDREKKNALETDWFHGVGHFEDRWVEGRNGGRKPDTIAKFSAMLVAISPLKDFLQDPPKLLTELFAQKKAWFKKLEDSRTPEATIRAQSALAALDTIRSKVPQLFPIVEEK